MRKLILIMSSWPLILALCTVKHQKLFIKWSKNGSRICHGGQGKLLRMIFLDILDVFSDVGRTLSALCFYNSNTVLILVLILCSCYTEWRYIWYLLCGFKNLNKHKIRNAQKGPRWLNVTLMNEYFRVLMRM